ncbi:hypothetical protein KP509_02G050700 [Ceratopteris richardii]|uniref:Uncharacterized protein n=1 Tax=Ceratopteris richardii TaxID=49495 RepID=A0A8T2V5R5_CERRI|nr:hypothetical protein KP509_02G050700 [Ceratopteris richardii]
MDALSSASVVPTVIAQTAEFSKRSLFYGGNVGLPATWRKRCVLKVERISSGAIASGAGISFSITAAEDVDVSKVVPQADRVLVRLEELPEQSSGGVLLPKAAVKFEHYLCGEVLSVGKDASGVTAGQKVLFSDLNAYEVNFGTKEKLCFVKAGDLLALVE